MRTMKFASFLTIVLVLGKVLIVAQTSSFSQCSPETRGEHICTALYLPVCGLDGGQNPIKTFSNSCVACQRLTVQYFTSGECSSNLPPKEDVDPNAEFIICQDPRPEMCTEEYINTCGLFDGAKVQCIRAPCGQQYGNGCSACSDVNVQKYYFGECNSTGKPQKELDTIVSEENGQVFTFCQDPRPEICTMQFINTCGLFDLTNIRCIKFPCGKQYSNGCVACSDKQVEKYFLGECSELVVDKVEETSKDKEDQYFICTDPRPEICTEEYTDTCGLFQGTSSQCTNPNCYEQYSNGCYACADIRVQKYFYGECDQPIDSIIPQNSDPNLLDVLEVKVQDDEQFIICQNPRPEMCTLEYIQTCGVFFGSKAKCIEEPCGQQYGNSCSACSDVNVEKYFFGNCIKYVLMLQQKQQIRLPEPSADDMKSSHQLIPTILTICVILLIVI